MQTVIAVGVLSAAIARIVAGVACDRANKTDAIGVGVLLLGAGVLALRVDAAAQAVGLFWPAAIGGRLVACAVVIVGSAVAIVDRGK